MLKDRLIEALASNYQYYQLPCSRRELEELQALLNRQSQYIWTDQPPTEPGRYFVRKYGPKWPASVVYIGQCSNGSLMFDGWSVSMQKGYQFAGPIEPPAEAGPIVIAEKQEAAVSQSFRDAAGVEANTPITAGPPAGQALKEDMQSFYQSWQRGELLGAIARGYCTEANQHKPLDAKLCEAIAFEVEQLQKPRLPDGLELWGVRRHGEWIDEYGKPLVRSSRYAAERSAAVLGSAYTVCRMYPPEPPQHPLLAAIDRLGNDPDIPLNSMLTLRSLAEPLVAQNADMRAMLEKLAGGIMFGRDTEIRELLARLETV